MPFYFLRSSPRLWLLRPRLHRSILSHCLPDTMSRPSSTKSWGISGNRLWTKESGYRFIIEDHIQYIRENCITVTVVCGITEGYAEFINDPCLASYDYVI